MGRTSGDTQGESFDQGPVESFKFYRASTLKQEVSITMQAKLFIYFSLNFLEPQPE